MVNKKLVGISSTGYPEIRNFQGLDLKKYTFVKKQNLHKVPAHFYFRSFNKIHSYYLNSFRDFDLNKVLLFHFFNGVSYGNTPWVSTFETFLPRWGQVSRSKMRKGIELMSRDSCKKLIAISECTRNIQLNFIRENFPDLLSDIEKKLMVLHPAQRVILDTFDKQITDEKIHFVIVGHEFFLKGGLEILRALEEIFAEGFKNWKLTIVSRLQYGDFASQTTHDDYEEAQQIIRKFDNQISHYPQLANKQVLEILMKAHVSLLPSYADTYGYSVLEAQAAGCPVITTDIRALPEINSAECGWLIPVEKDKLGYAKIKTPGDRKKFSDSLLNSLKQTFKSILQNPNEIIIKGRFAHERIVKHHSPDDRAKVLEQLYDDIVSGEI